MTSERKAEANRKNCRHSTGPRSVAGKQSARRNAWKHGLAVPITEVPLFCSEIEEFVRELMHGHGGQELRLARTVAEAQLELVRIKSYRATRLAARLAAG